MNNFHVILVHFPVAFLTIYGVLELLRFRKLLSLPYWFYIKATLVIIGAGASWLAVVTGGMIEESFENTPALRSLIELHATFALGTATFASILALLYLLSWAGRQGFMSTKSWVEKILNNNWVMFIAGVIILKLVTIVGALGGAIAFGQGVDPLSDLIYTFFFPVQ